jgi:DNA-binding NtrC family response regulator
MRPILIVDDDEGIRRLLRQIITGMGYEVVEAEGAIEALELLERVEIGLALCDIRMPGRDGVWLMDQILTRFPGTPIALATGLTEMDPAVTLRAGVIGYVVKPFDRRALAEVIRVASEAAPPRRPRQIDLAGVDAG